MISDSFLTWIALQSAKLDRHFGSATKREEVLARLAKLTEECGELADEVLASDGHQRKEKLADKQNDSLGHELADVLITTLLLAEKMRIDVNVALKKKVGKIDRRYEKIERSK